MGFKRPFDEEEFQGFTLRHPKQLDCGNKLTSFTEINPCHEPTQKADIPGEGGGLFCKSKVGDGFEHDGRNVVSDLADKKFEIGAPLSGVTSNTAKEDAASGAAVYPSLSPGYLELHTPRTPIGQVEPTYSSLWDGSPIRQVPIGSNHQVDVPEWDPQAMEKYRSNSDHIGDAYCGKLTGDCIFVMPDPELSPHSGFKVGEGRKDCLCLDQGSLRCMRQHIMEARERVRETLGNEKFVQLGFGEMGEEISQKWTEEEQLVFHQVVYSNPVSHGRKFWGHLSAVFPSRTKMEIVSYYFNVFMLRRRAVQNRSNFLDIDSDDDEWQGSDGGPFGVTQEVVDTAIGFLDVQDVCVDHDDDSPDDNSSDGDGDEYDEDDDNGDSDDYDVDAGNGGGNTTESNGGISLLLKAQMGVPVEDRRSDFVVDQVGKNLGSYGENFGGQNVSSIAFDCQPCIADSVDSADQKADVQESSAKGDCKEGLQGNDHGSADGLGPSYFLEPCDAKVWDARYPMSPLKGVDLLSTGNMIEEIFGSPTQNSKSSDEKSIN